MTASDEEQFEKDAAERYGRMIGADNPCVYCQGPKRCRVHGDSDGPVLGVLTGQVPVRSMPIAGKHEPRCNDLCRGESHHLCGPECGRE